MLVHSLHFLRLRFVLRRRAHRGRTHPLHSPAAPRPLHQSWLHADPSSSKSHALRRRARVRLAFSAETQEFATSLPDKHVQDNPGRVSKSLFRRGVHKTLHQKREPVRKKKCPTPPLRVAAAAANPCFASALLRTDQRFAHSRVV